MTHYANNAAINNIVPAFLAMQNTLGFFETSGKYEVRFMVDGHQVICRLEINKWDTVLFTDVLDTAFRDEVLRECRTQLRRLVMLIDGDDESYDSACDPDSAEYAYRE